MKEDVDFIMLAMTYDHTRTDRGLHHYPKLLHAKALQKALKKEFGNVRAQVDPDRDPVALVVLVSMDLSDPARDLDRHIAGVFNRMARIAEEISGGAQHLHLFILASVQQSLNELGVTTPCFHHIARPGGPPAP
jgi:hypothetical protein